MTAMWTVSGQCPLRTRLGEFWVILIALQLVAARGVLETQVVLERDVAYEVVLPTLTTKDGLPIVVDIQPSLPRYNRRMRRSISPGNIEELELSLELGSDSSVNVHLHKLDLVSPGARIEWLLDNTTESTYIQTGCLYEGRIEGINGSMGVLSLCKGVRGTLSTPTEDIYLKPLSERDTGNIHRPHMIFRKPHRSRRHPYHLRRDHWTPRRGRDRKHGRGRGHHLGRGRSKGPGKRRPKRDLYRQGPKYIEVLLATDNTVVNYHGEDLVEQYLLTMMSIVNSIYQHPTLEVEMHVVVVRMLVLQDNVADSLFVKGDGRGTLDRFCQWTYSNQPPKYPYDSSHDVAIYVTKRDIGPAGYAPVTGMCNPLRSCTIAKDDGISSAFVIAHEMGHVFGMHHDGVGNACEEDPSDGKIMAAMVQAAYDKFYWTECSIAKLELYLDDYHCLDNKPSEPGWPTFSEPFGQSWSLDEQCSQEFGNTFSLCQAFDNLDPCEYLWCSEEASPLLCKTKRGPPLPGTACAKGKWCMNGRCQWVSETERQMASWSEWSEWGDCSRTCGIGVQYRHRSCRSDEDENCSGRDEGFQLCNEERCEGDPKDIREEQCDLFNNRKLVGNRYHTWLPLENKDVSLLCRMTCISKETADVIVTHENAIDGTFCTYEVPNDICIGGKCQKLSCDGVLNGPLKEDTCGVCGGDNTSCRTVVGKLNRRVPNKEYFNVFKLPKGARSVLVTESKDTPHFIALHDNKADKYILNGDDQQQHSGQVVYHGTRFVYINQDKGESLSARGPLLGDLEVMVYSVSSKVPASVDYEFIIPQSQEYSQVDENNVETDIESIDTPYIWKFVEWSECSKTCGKGETGRIHVCIDETTQEEVSEGLCSLFTKPLARTKSCSQGRCPATFRWEAGEWQSCSATCGKEGRQQRHVLCMTTHYGYEQSIDPRYCDIKKVPIYHQKCNQKSCPASWKTSGWSKCSVTCGSGIKTRKAYCDKPDDGNRYECDGEQPFDTKICDMKPCPVVTDAPTLEPTTTVTSTTHHQEEASTGDSTTTTPTTTPYPLTTVKMTTTVTTPGPNDTSGQNSTDPDRDKPKPKANLGTDNIKPEENSPSVKEKAKVKTPDTQKLPKQYPNCRKDRSFFCRLGTNFANCSIPAYRRMCCMSCGMFKII